MNDHLTPVQDHARWVVGRAGLLWNHKRDKPSDLVALAEAVQLAYEKVTLRGPKPKGEASEAHANAEVGEETARELQDPSES